jgi:hypothetical protein
MRFRSAPTLDGAEEVRSGIMTTMLSLDFLRGGADISPQRFPICGLFPYVRALEQRHY